MDLEPKFHLPEMRLLVAVLHLAIVDYVDPKTTDYFRWQAAKWLFSRERGPMSLWWICQWMSDSPDELRDRLLEAVKKMKEKPKVLLSRVDKRTT
jgi:hypothetical protein